MNSEQLEKYSSAVTLSDMEVFVFPELMYSLVLANIISPVIWRWRQQDCFKKLEGKGAYKKLMRLKQFVIDEYEFNLDLETWGLTSKSKELKRFEEFVPLEVIAQSNALFGYEGDKYYFDVDIRKHFGLDKYDSDIIPYWKTETVEAMNAFRRKRGYGTAAGECVSLSALYAAAAFIVCGVPLEDIYMVLTPLHSQNFIDVQDGVLTNNRRLVTKVMWFNGTALSDKAQRALRNESVTIVGHSSGYVHCVYDDATINKDSYEYFLGRLGSYLSVKMTMRIFANFLRSHPKYQKFFQICRDCRGQAQFLKAEVLFHYEHGSNFRIADETHDKLLAEVSDEDFVSYPLPDRIRCDEFEEFIHREKIDPMDSKSKEPLKKYIGYFIPQSQKFVDELADFLHIEAKLPSPEKNYVPFGPIKIDVKWSRDEIIEYLQSIRQNNSTAELAFYAYRDMESCDWQPFVKAAVERNPVSIEMMGTKNIDEVYDWLMQMNDESIYEGKRLAQPDEVANYKTGDGLEKAFLLANVICHRNPEQELQITVADGKVVISGDGEYRFESGKDLEKQVCVSGVGAVNVIEQGREK